HQDDWAHDHIASLPLVYFVALPLPVGLTGSWPTGVLRPTPRGSQHNAEQRGRQIPAEPPPNEMRTQHLHPCRCGPEELARTDVRAIRVRIRPIGWLRAISSCLTNEPIAEIVQCGEPTPAFAGVGTRAC